MVELWQDELGPFPPYRLDADACIFAYAFAAEFGTHIAQGWGQPACAIDALVEFRHFANYGHIKSTDRDKGFFRLDGALRYFKEDAIDLMRKDVMRDRIMQGPPFTVQERQDILAYCRDDVEALTRLLRHLVPTIRSLPHAYMRASFVWVNAQKQHRGVPLDGPVLDHIRERWEAMRTDLVIAMDGPFGCYEIVDGKAHWRMHLFEDLIRRRGYAWPTLESGTPDTTAETFGEMAIRYPELEPLRELRSSLSDLRLNKLEVGRDGRNRTPLWAYGTKTARNAPGGSAYVFGPAKWIRFLITPPPGFALVHRDYKQQEMYIAALLSGDSELLAACETGDVYLGIGKQLGLIPQDATKHPLRSLLKSVCLGISYGLGVKSLALRTGISMPEAGEILARLRARFRRYEEFTLRVADKAGLLLELSTPFGWYMRCPPGMNPRIIRNFPMQSTASEVLHAACILAERRKIRLVASVHDALMVECPAGAIEEASTALDRVMRDAAAVVLGGYELPTDVQPIKQGERFFDDRGLEMWNTVYRLAGLKEVASA